VAIAIAVGCTLHFEHELVVGFGRFLAAEADEEARLQLVARYGVIFFDQAYIRMRLAKCVNLRW
jgi:hypothetical protein